MPTAHLADRRLHIRASLRRVAVRPVRPIRETAQTLIAVPTNPPVHRLPRDTEPLGHLGHRHTSRDLQHRPVPLLCHSPLHQHSAECHASSEANL